MNLLMIDIKDQKDQGRYSQKHPKAVILMLECLRSLKNRHQCSGYPSDGGNDQKNPNMHRGEAQNVTKRVLWKTRDQKKDETENGSFMFNQIIKFLPRLF